MFIITSYIIFGRIRTYNKLLVVCLSIADVGKGLSCMLSAFYFLPGQDVSAPGQPTPLCFIQALGIQFFEMSGFLWPGIIATHLYLAVCRKTPYASLRRLLPLHLAVGYGIPVLLAVGIVALNAIGNSNPEPVVTWCWVEGQHGWVRLAFYYLPMVLLWCYNIALYWLISREVGKIMSFAYRHVVTRLALYILILIITDVPALINRLQVRYYSFFSFSLASVDNAGPSRISLRPNLRLRSYTICRLWPSLFKVSSTLSYMA